MAVLEQPEDDSEDGDVSYITYYGCDLKLSARDYLVDPLSSWPHEIPAAITYPVRHLCQPEQRWFEIRPDEDSAD
ncbi:hypothetical protein RRF57_001715 [Xylaria bambusicola]|uniref:Uncharacterized protein n=1 Tax=Xylaria bambusicola TaxID=326684 RepID=A0AAN7URD7_9PEZI